MVAQGRESIQARAEANRHMFARIAHRYDLVNTLMTFGRDAAWRKAAAQAALPHGGLGLDMATGTGELAIAMAARAERVIGVDICEEMIRLGHSKVARLPRGRRVQFLLADGLRLPFPDATFDGAATGFALRNVADLATALSELHRVLKPGGKLACLELTRNDLPPVAALHSAYMNTIVPVLGGWLTGDTDAYRYLARSQRQFLEAGELKQLLMTVGFCNVRYDILHFGSVALHVGQKGPAPTGQNSPSDVILNTGRS